MTTCPVCGTSHSNPKYCSQNCSGKDRGNERRERLNREAEKREESKTSLPYEKISCPSHAGANCPTCSGKGWIYKLK